MGYEMNYNLSNEQVKEYHKNGYIIIKNVIKGKYSSTSKVFKCQEQDD